MNSKLPDVDTLLDEMTRQIKSMSSSQALMIGIHTGGVWLAQKLHHLVRLETALGTLDITFYRDDFSTIGLHPQVNPSNLPEDIEGRDIILVDDVLQTGRTIRAALNEVFSYGRPNSVVLAVLVDRGLRELPIQADVCGLKIDLDAQRQIKLSGPDTLKLTITDKDASDT